MAKKRKGQGKVEREIRRVRRPIDDERRSQLAYEMAHVTKEIGRERDEKASELKVFNDHIKELEARMRRLADDVDEGREDRDIECVVLRDFEGNKVRYFDATTYDAEATRQHHAVDERAMTAEEREKLEQVTIAEVIDD